MPRCVMVLAALALLASSERASAQEECSAGRLKGRYVFVGRGFIEALEPGVQRMHFGYFVFDGAGNVSGKQSSSRGGKIGREMLEGTYRLDADCSGVMAFQFAGNPRSETRWDLYVSRDGKRGHIIRMDEGNMAVRSFEQ